MHNLERLTLAEMKEFVKASRTVRIDSKQRGAIYAFLEAVLKAQQYRRLGKRDKGIVRSFLAKVSGRSRAQVTRLVTRWVKTRRIQPQTTTRRQFPRRYTDQDIRLLAEVDTAHEDLSGPAVRRILQREHQVYGKAEFGRLADISASHIYNLRASAPYCQQRVRVHHTQARQVSIAERRKPDPRGQPGWLRVDTVHQGNHDGHPGLYHVNAVDTVTQWEVIGCVETISERHLLPVLQAILHQFPFRILGFHCDNGSEFVNHTVARLLNKLLIEFTKSRPYRTMDNALVEGKNGAVVRKYMGHGPITASHAEAFQKFYTAHLNPYLNFHRPCGFATIRMLGRGKRRRCYAVDDYRTPYEKLTSLPDWQQYLKEAITTESLQQRARRHSDTEAATQMQKAKLALLTQCRRSR